MKWMKTHGCFSKFSNSDVTVPVFRAIDSSCRGEKHNQPRFGPARRHLVEANGELVHLTSCVVYGKARPWKGPLGVESRLLMSHERS